MTRPASYLINLDRATARREHVTARIGMLGLPLTRIAAVDGAQLPAAERDAFAAARPRDGRRGWRPGQIGCFLSHFEAWTRIAAGTATWGLVLEDDLHLSDATPAVLVDLSWIPGDADIVRLESTGQWLKLGRSAGSIAGRAVRPIRSAAWGAGAYLLSRDSAARLVATPAALHTPADDFLFNLAGSAVAQGLATYQLVPAIATQDKFSADTAAIHGFGSDIETDAVNQRLRGLSALRRRWTSALRGKTAVEFV